MVCNLGNSSDGRDEWDSSEALSTDRDSDKASTSTSSGRLVVGAGTISSVNFAPEQTFASRLTSLEGNANKVNDFLFGGGDETEANSPLGPERIVGSETQTDSFITTSGSVPAKESTDELCDSTLPRIQASQKEPSSVSGSRLDSKTDQTKIEPLTCGVQASITSVLGNESRSRNGGTDHGMANTDLHEKEEETKSDEIAVDVKLSNKVDDSNCGAAALSSPGYYYDPNQKQHSKMFGQPTHPSQRSSLLLYIKDRENQTISVLAQQIEILEQSILELKSSRPQ